jgi:hypothetical protein
VQLPTIERRFKVAVLVAAGVCGTRSLPEVDPANCAPRLRLPVFDDLRAIGLHVSASHVAGTALRALETEPANKRGVVFETNHMPVTNDPFAAAPRRGDRLRMRLVRVSCQTRACLAGRQEFDHAPSKLRARWGLS